MTTRISNKLTVNEENLLELLTTKLYSTDPNLTIRELLQNSSDAMNEAGGHDSQHIISIDLEPYGDNKSVSITDTGIGMNKEDLETKLAVIADGNKLKRAVDNAGIAGRFGIGFLSTMIIADTVEVLTRKEGDETSWKFVLNKKGEYTIEESTKFHNRGTKVTLFLGDNRTQPRELTDKISDLMTEEGMKAAIQEWGYLLKFPISLKVGKGSRGAVNARRMPWEDNESANIAFEDIFNTSSEPLFVFRFENIESNQLSFSGVFYFTSGVIFEPTARLYSRGLLIDAENSSLLPVYAPFAYCLVECNQLNIDLARRHAEDDNIYRDLSHQVWKQFTLAFVRFAQSQTEDLVKLWGSVDNTVISRMLHLLETSEERLRKKREAAADFMIQAAVDLPFFILDQISGGQGRPVWKTIRELRSSKLNDLDMKFDADEIIDIPYTESKVPVEKDILVEQYGELIDVGRETSAHEALIRALTTKHEEISRLHRIRLLPTILPESEEISDEERQKLWDPSLDCIFRNVNFYQRRHEVIVQRITPEDTPVIIGLEDVDDEIVTALRGQLAEAGLAGPKTATIMQKLDGVLNKMDGSKVQVRVNADNKTMQTLAAAYLVETTKPDAEIALQTITWRAILDYFGASATRTMIAQERTNVSKLVSNLIRRGQLLANAEDKQNALQMQVDESRIIAQAVNQEPAEPSERIIGIVDIAGSTLNIFGNTHSGPEDKIYVLKTIVNGIAERISEFAKITAYTGDGLQFIVNEELDNTQKSVIGVKLKGLSGYVLEIIADDDRLNSFFNQRGAAPIALRTALDCGMVHEMKFADRIVWFGLPYIYATRLVSNSDIYTKASASVMITGEAHNAMVGSNNFWRATNIGDADKFEVKGMQPDSVDCYPINE